MISRDCQWDDVVNPGRYCSHLLTSNCTIPFSTCVGWKWSRWPTENTKYSINYETKRMIFQGEIHVCLEECLILACIYMIYLFLVYGESSLWIQHCISHGALYIWHVNQVIFNLIQFYKDSCVCTCVKTFHVYIRI